MRATSVWILIAMLMGVCGLAVAGCWYRSCNIMRYDNHIPPPHNLDVWFYKAGAVVRHIQLEVDEELSEAFADWRAGSADWN